MQWDLKRQNNIEKEEQEDLHCLISTLNIAYSNQDSVIKCKERQVDWWKE